jgi:cyclopropane-fatty-acyl-phospholipid synthase
MAERAHVEVDQGAHAALVFLQELLADYHPVDFAIELWDGTCWGPEPGQFCRFTWKINHPEVLRSVMKAPSEVSLGEAYIEGDFDLEGDIHAVFQVSEYLLNRQWTLREKLRLRNLLLRFPSRSLSSHAPGFELRGRLHSRSRDREAVTYHYDLSNDFYALWLDRNLVYSCAYFEKVDDDLETAQSQKLDYICRKLRLKPGQRLLDIGCGWGGLILHATQNYGVHARGVTLSQCQFELAQQRIQRAGLSDRCQVELLDYRQLHRFGEYDKLVSVGMVEHVGKSQLAEYFRQAFRLLRPGGAFLNHGIGQAGNRPAPAQPSFTDAYVFPDGELVPISTMLHVAEHAGFEVRDVENLREHYVLTLSHWLRRLEANAASARQLTGEAKYRIWRLYLAGSAHYFRTGKLDLYQTLLLKSENRESGLPLTRADWY